MEHRHFWMVKAEGHNPTTHKHHSFEDAQAEANRLAVQNPGRKFFVLQTVGFARKEAAEWHEMDTGELIPF